MIFMKTYTHKITTFIFLSQFLLSTAYSTPLGSQYEVILDAFLPSGQIEGHFGPVLFDGSPDPILNDLVPLTPDLPGHDLFVTEHVEDIFQGNNKIGEHISIWVLGDDFDPFVPLFNNNPIEQLQFEVTGLNWRPESPGGVVSNIQLTLSFGQEGGLLLPVFPTFSDISGSGTVDDPLFMSFGLNGFDFNGIDGSIPTDIHLDFDVSHVPIPAALPLFLTGLIGFLAASRRRYRPE